MRNCAMTPDEKHPYHHGDLRAALLAAAEAELAEKGVEGFTLRGCAKRAGVSHAAPAHHFRDADALLTALAAIGSQRLTDSMLARHAAAPDTPMDQYIASGIGYVDFALSNRALFKLMFGSDRPDFSDPQLSECASEAFGVLIGDVAALRRDDPMASPAGRLEVASSWAMVHGLASLLISGALSIIQKDFENDRDGVLRELISRVAPR